MTAIEAELIQHMGSDLTVVNAARVSFDKESTLGHFKEWDDDLHEEVDVELLKYEDSRLLNYLAKHQHWTPFAHCQITLRETVPIFVARQRFKHVVGFVYNEVSRRYVSDEPEFYVPTEWRSKAANVKQGSLDEPVEHIWKSYGWSKEFDGPTTECPINLHIRMGDKEQIEPQVAYKYAMVDLLHLYQDMIDSGIAPEQARMVLPQSMMTSYYVTGSLAAFARAYKQRSDSHSQKEIQELAGEWDRLIRPLFPESWLALTTNHV